jgi:hypothetical protein
MRTCALVFALMLVGCPANNEPAAPAPSTVTAPSVESQTDAQLVAVLRSKVTDGVATAYYEAWATKIAPSDLAEYGAMFGAQLDTQGSAALAELKRRHP